MKKCSFGRNWIILFFCVPLLAIVPFGDIVITQQVVNSGDPTWKTLVPVYVISFVLISGIAGSLLTELLTTYNSDGVQRLALLGGKSIKWKEITLVKGYSKFVRLNYLELRGAGKRIRINTLFYRDIGELIKLISTQAPSAKWE